MEGFGAPAPCAPLWAPLVSPLLCPCNEPVPAEPSSVLLALHTFVAPARVSRVQLIPCTMQSWGLILSAPCATPVGVPWPWPWHRLGWGWLWCPCGARGGALVLAEPWLLLLLSKPHSEVVTEPWSHVPAWKVSLTALGCTSTTARTQEFSVHKYLNTCIFLYDRFIQCVPLSAVKSLQHL